MKTHIAILLAVALPLSGCATYDRIKAQTAEVWQSGKIQKTLLIAAREVGMFVGSQVLSLAVSGKDFKDKSDYLQGLTEALWANSGQLADPNTVLEIARAWTPEKSHWEDLAQQLTADFAAKNPQTKEEVAAILSGYAHGIYIATHKTPGDLKRDKLTEEYDRALKSVAFMEAEDPQGYQEVRAIIDAGYELKFEELKGTP